MSGPTLLFVYNANADVVSTAFDFAHKLFSPATYSCPLCALTYGRFTEKQDWRNFIDRLPVPAVFLHKDEFARHYNHSAALPAVFLQSGINLEEMISAAELQGCQTLPDLQHLVIHKLKSHGQHHHPHL